ncbi:MAG: hypothetical protein M3R20_03445 [Pseudomonadota bacterium]|nr:hypothetical protein [Pseudomonadota bacterium]
MFACALGSVVAVAGCSTRAPQSHDLVPLWETASSEASDTFYTTDFAQRNASMASGLADHGVAAWIACAAGALAGPHGEIPSAPVHDDLGYSVPMAFACAPPAQSTPLYRLYKNAPQTDHVYASSIAEFDAWRRRGYVFERIEGYVWKSPIAGSVALYRISRCADDAVSCAAEHRYSISVDTRDTLAAAGWQVQGIAGYVFAGYDNADTFATFTGTINGVVGDGTTPTRIALRNVIPPKTEMALGGGNRHRVFGELSSNSTQRPAGADRQRIVFSLYTGDLFVAATTPLDHIPIWLYGHTQIASDGQGGVPYDGLGLFFSLPQWGNRRCASDLTTGGQIFVEEMAKAKVDCAANLAQPLQPDRWYDIALTVTDRAELSYTIKDRESGQLFTFSKSYADDYACPIGPAPGSLDLTKLYCNNPFSYDRFPAQRTGYFIWPIFRGTAATSGRIANVDVQWLDSREHVLSGK